MRRVSLCYSIAPTKRNLGSGLRPVGVFPRLSSCAETAHWAASPRHLPANRGDDCGPRSTTFPQKGTPPPQLLSVVGGGGGGGGARGLWSAVVEVGRGRTEGGFVVGVCCRRRWSCCRRRAVLLSEVFADDFGDPDRFCRSRSARRFWRSRSAVVFARRFWRSRSAGVSWSELQCWSSEEVAFLRSAEQLWPAVCRGSPLPSPESST